MLYNQCSDGGSAQINAHLEMVRAAVSCAISDNPILIPRAGEHKPVAAHLPGALDLAKHSAARDLARALRPVAAQLSWEYGYTHLHDALARTYAYCEILGPKGPIPYDDLILGCVLLAPDTTYPRHRHDGIEESYITMSGAWSQNNAGVYGPGTLVFNPAGYDHEITTGKTAPCLLAYAWVGPHARLAEPGMVFSSVP